MGSLGLGGGGGAIVPIAVDQGAPNAGGVLAWPVQGADAEGAAATGKPVAVGAKDASGNIQPFRSAVFADVNGTLAPAATLQRVAADLMVQDAVGNLTNRVRSARDLIAGLVGSTMSATGSSVYDSAAALFRPRLGDAAGRENVVGASAAGSAVAGNPLLMGASDGTNAQYLLTAGSNLRVTIGQSAAFASVATPGDGATNANALYNFGLTGLWNGTNWDRSRNNIDVTLLTSASRTTTQTSADITTYNLRGINVTLDMTIVGTGSVTVSIDGKDPASGKYYNLLTGAAIVGNGTNTYKIYPAGVIAANVSANDHLPRIIRIVVTANNANAATYSVGYTLLA